MLGAGTHSKSASTHGSSHTDTSSTTQESNPKSVSARLSAGMMPFFIPPNPSTTQGQRPSCENTNVDSALDPTLMTPPMSPTEASFGFDLNSTIEGRFSASYSSSMPSSHAHMQSHPDKLSQWMEQELSATPGSEDAEGSSQLSTTLGSSLMVSPRPTSFHHWDRYQDYDSYSHDIHSDQDFEDEDTNDLHEDSGTTSDDPYSKRFEGHHSIVRRRRLSFGDEESERSLEKSYRRGRAGEPYDSFRHGIGLNVSDLSDEIEKARTTIIQASSAMKNMEQELATMQLRVDESKASHASTRSAIEENFWRLECLARTIEKDRQDAQKRIQTVGRDCQEAMETVTNWEVRIDWLGKRVDNTADYASELVLSEQECMSFIRMIIQQNRRYAMPAISRRTEHGIRLMAPPRLREIAASSHRSGTPPHVQSTQQRTSSATSPSPSPSPSPQPPLQPQPSVRHIPISWLLDPLAMPKSTEPSLSPAPERAMQDAADEAGKAKKAAADSQPELWRDFSRLTTALEAGQTRSAFSPFQRARSSSIGQGSAITNPTGFGFQTGGGGSSSTVTPGSGSSLFKANLRRPQVENMSPLPKVLPPVVPTPKVPVVKRRSQHIPQYPGRSWLKFQFYKTRAAPGAPASPGARRSTVLGFKPITIFQTTA